MSKAPTMPMFWDAYLADTTHLTTEEHGAYLLLLAAMWRRNGWVPDNDRDNARILGLTQSKWRRTKERLAGFLTFEDGHITQKNLLKIWKITQEKIEKNRANGALGGRPKSSKNNDIEKANGCVSLNPNKTIPDPDPDPIKNNVHFAQFWNVWPHKKSKAQAEKAWAKIPASERQEVIDKTPAWCRQWREDNPKASHILPASYLNGRRWEDEASPTEQGGKVDYGWFGSGRDYSHA